ncbi:carbohydrate kinase family protein [Phytomonospora endophytica]|uniref:Fructokinase n=1 Tax=Phytomonospora endophytica TaxID=714109 RepID=A0A841FG40_9ACTN|nr:carbohydrate kinase [Phytomonospora endophytica]MBB6034834.1 fructokinase [Phytomonospora endophytica]GIG68962.1 ribokinase [Phytomonospora endophytica]
MTAIAVIGEAVADAFLPATGDRAPAGGGFGLRVTPGGSPANTAVALARLGTRARFLGRLSTGPLGRLLRAHLDESGVDLSAAVPTKRKATLAVTALDAEGRADYDFYVAETADWHWTPEELAHLTDTPVDAVHTGSLALALDPGAARIRAALAAARPHATICVDPNARPGLIEAAAYREGLPRWLPLADIVKVSDEDLAYIHPGETPAAIGERWHAMGVRLIVVTRGGNGAVASFDGELTEVPAVPADMVDTVGAGDAFSAGLLHTLGRLGRLGGRLDGLTVAEVREALEFAALVAARTCETSGANPPWAKELTP